MRHFHFSHPEELKGMAFNKEEKKLNSSVFLGVDISFYENTIQLILETYLDPSASVYKDASYFLDIHDTSKIPDITHILVCENYLNGRAFGLLRVLQKSLPQLKTALIVTHGKSEDLKNKADYLNQFASYDHIIGANQSLGNLALDVERFLFS